jgi:hypothetical protein
VVVAVFADEVVVPPAVVVSVSDFDSYSDIVFLAVSNSQQ